MFDQDCTENISAEFCRNWKEDKAVAKYRACLVSKAGNWFPRTFFKSILDIYHSLWNKFKQSGTLVDELATLLKLLFK